MQADFERLIRSLAQFRRQFSHPERQSKRKGCLDCRGPSALAMTRVMRYARSFVNVLWSRTGPET